MAITQPTAENTKRRPKRKGSSAAFFLSLYKLYCEDDGIKRLKVQDREKTCALYVESRPRSVLMTPINIYVLGQFYGCFSLCHCHALLL